VNQHEHDDQHERDQHQPDQEQAAPGHSHDPDFELAAPRQEHGHEHGHGHGHGHGQDWRGRLKEFFRPHSHDSADSVDSALESSEQGIRAVKVSLVVLGVTALAQGLLVVVTGSVALLADTIHNFSDALTALPLWVAFVLGRRPPSRRYTYGHGRAEDLAGVFIVAMIALSAVLAGWESVRRLLDPQELTLPWAVVAAGIIGFAGNEWVASYRIRVGRSIGSAALVADGLHARTDGFTSLAVVLGAVGALLGFPLADPLIGLAITVAILFVLRDAATQVYARLMDAVDPTLVDLAEAALVASPGVEHVDGVRLRWVGHRVLAEADIAVDANLSVVEGHAIAVEAHHRLLHEVPKLAEVTVHVSPAGTAGAEHHARISHHKPN